ncbi:hypothetical protein [Nonomuraea dietziae]|uniref:hypothetical protein n=1 Tax=Nonomuraea dietziae TaxID=65515 RepID=UPI0031CE23B1
MTIAVDGLRAVHTEPPARRRAQRRALHRTLGARPRTSCHGREGLGPGQAEDPRGRAQGQDSGWTDCA